jgi:hypothetical protein
MRLAICQRVTSPVSPPLAVARGERWRDLQATPHNLVLLACHHTKWMCDHGSTGIQVLHSTDSEYRTRHDVNRAPVYAQRTKVSAGKP